MNKEINALQTIMFQYQMENNIKNKCYYNCYIAKVFLEASNIKSKPKVVYCIRDDTETDNVIYTCHCVLEINGEIFDFSYDWNTCSTKYYSSLVEFEKGMLCNGVVLSNATSLTKKEIVKTFLEYNSLFKYYDLVKTVPAASSDYSQELFKEMALFVKYFDNKIKKYKI